MNKVITINLNGNAFQLEEAGYEKLHAYLEQAGAKLAGNPDKEEIVADFEQAIADKCAKYLSAAKTVVTVEEINEILLAMGPVEDAAGDDKHEAGPQGQTAPKRLFKIRQGAVIEGVCNGLAAYFNTDPTIVRVIFIVLLILTGGGWAVAYVLMAFFIPEAKTREDIAQAQGKEFNAQTLMANAHDRYEYWKEFGKKQKEMWEKDPAASKKYWKDWGDHVAAKAAATAGNAEEWSKKYASGNSFGRGLAGFFGAIGVLMVIALGILWLITLINILATGTFLGYFAAAPVWLIVLLVSCFFYLVFNPTQSITGDFLRYAAGKQTPPRVWGRVFSWITWLVAAGGIIAIIAYSTPVREGFQQMKYDYDHTHHIGR
jgi:phage shock protein PspC (stress-responsive transcriptional regulator)